MSARDDLLAKDVTSVVATATHAAATITITAPTNNANTIFVTGVKLSSRGGTPTAVSATLSDGAGVVDQWEIPAAVFAPIVENFGTHPIRITPGNNAVLTLPDMGASIVGTVVLKYYIGSI